MPILHKPELANPSKLGLFTAARIIERPDPNRLFDGITVESWNCGAGWVLPIECEAEIPDPPPQGAEDRTPPLGFEGWVVGADDDCSLMVPEAEAQQRAAQLLRLREWPSTEAKVAEVLLDMADTPTEVDGLVAAVGALEEEVAGFGFPGVLHAAPHLLAALQSAQLITRSGTQLLSPSGHRWAFGAGYGELGETIVATGPVDVHRGAVDYRHGPEHQTNERLTTAFREVVVTWECFTTAVTIGA